MLNFTEFVTMNLSCIFVVLVCLPLFCKAVKVDYDNDGVVGSAAIVIIVFIISGLFLLSNNFSDQYIVVDNAKMNISFEKDLSPVTNITPEKGNICTKYNVIYDKKIVGNITTCYISPDPTK